MTLPKQIAQVRMSAGFAGDFEGMFYSVSQKQPRIVRDGHGSGYSERSLSARDFRARIVNSVLFNSKRLQFKRTRKSEHTRRKALPYDGVTDEAVELCAETNSFSRNLCQSKQQYLFHIFREMILLIQQITDCKEH